MNNKKTLAIAGAIGATTITFAAQAVPITGSISMDGLANLATANGSSASIGTATEVVFVPGYVYVGASSQDFATVPFGTIVNMASPWVFSPSTALSSLWSVGGTDGFTFTFDAASETFTQSADFLNIIGVGTISSSNPNLDSTSFDWSITFDTPPSGGPVQFNFSAYTIATEGQGVPDGGLTVALLGLSLAGVECFRRKLSRA